MASPSFFLRIIRVIFLGFFPLLLVFPVGCGSNSSGEKIPLSAENPSGSSADSQVSVGATDTVATGSAPQNAEASHATPTPTADGSTSAISRPQLGPTIPYDMLQVSLGLDETVNFDTWVLDSLDSWSRINLHKPADLEMTQDGVPTVWLQLYAIHKSAGSAPAGDTGGTPAAAPGSNVAQSQMGLRVPFDMVQAALGLDEIVQFDTWVLDSLDSWSRVNLHKPADLAMTQDGVPTSWLQLYLIHKSHS